MSEKKKLFTATYYFGGKRYYVRSSKSQRDAERKAAKAQQEREDGSKLIGEDIRVWDYALRWVETYKSETVCGPVYKAYLSRVKKYIIPEIGAMRVREVRASNLQTIMNHQAGKSKDFCTKMLATIHAIFKQAVRDDIIRKDPSETITAPKATDGTHRSLTEEERTAALAVAESNPFGPAVKWMLYCGLRPQEAVALKWSDIDQINKRVMIRRALKKDGTIGEPKSAAGIRAIPIPPKLWDTLQIPNDLNAYILLNTRGERHSHTSLRWAWELFRRDMDIALGANYVIGKYNKIMIENPIIEPDVNMYCFRHTYCTDLEAAGVPINVAKYLMGHSKIELTARIYTHMREDTLSDAAEKIASIGATAGATQNEITYIKNNKEFTESKP